METNCGQGYTWGFRVVSYIFRKHDQALAKLRGGVYICVQWQLYEKTKGFGIWQTWFWTVAKISGLFHVWARPSGELLNLLELALLCTHILCSDILCGSDSEFWCLLFLWALVRGCLFPYEPWDCCSEFRFLGTFSVGMLTLKCFSSRESICFPEARKPRDSLMFTLGAFLFPEHSNGTVWELSSIARAFCGLEFCCFIFTQYQGLRQSVFFVAPWKAHYFYFAFTLRMQPFDTHQKCGKLLLSSPPGVDSSFGALSLESIDTIKNENASSSEFS